MFKKFDPSLVSSTNILKSSHARSIRNSIVDQFPPVADYIDLIWPKKADVVVGKCRNAERTNIFYIDGLPCFFNTRDVKDSPHIPTLRLLHRFPIILPKMQVDRGAIKFALKGADMMAPGFTSAGGSMDDVEAGQVVAIMAEGKEHAVGVGIAKKSTSQIREDNIGIAVEMVHFIGDGLYNITSL
ncbi:hypothetical protein P9112_011990 [Eukaryota sp. TZLM1-RC]